MNIDAEIAEKLFGVKELNFSPSRSPVLIVVILEALRKKGFSVVITHYDYCVVEIEIGEDPFDERKWTAEDQSLPLALCKAALLALEGR